MNNDTAFVRRIALHDAQIAVDDLLSRYDGTPLDPLTKYKLSGELRTLRIYYFGETGDIIAKVEGNGGAIRARLTERSGA